MLLLLLRQPISKLYTHALSLSPCYEPSDAIRMQLFEALEPSPWPRLGDSADGGAGVQLDGGEAGGGRLLRPHARSGLRRPPRTLHRLQLSYDLGLGRHCWDQNSTIF